MIEQIKIQIQALREKLRQALLVEREAAEARNKAKAELDSKESELFRLKLLEHIGYPYGTRVMHKGKEKMVVDCERSPYSAISANALILATIGKNGEPTKRTCKEKRYFSECKIIIK